MTPQGFHQNSARSVWVPLSVVPQPQYGNGTVWQDAGLRVANFQGSVIAADRDAPPGLQVRFGASEQWLNLGPGEVLWAPRSYTEVHARIWRMGAGVPVASTSYAHALRVKNSGGLFDLTPRYESSNALLGASGFSLYNAPIQAFPGSRSAFPGGLFLSSSSLQTRSEQCIQLGNWFSQADLNGAQFFVVEGTLRAVDGLLGTMVSVAAPGATFSPYIQMSLRDPFDSQQQAVNIGAVEGFAAGNFLRHGTVHFRVSFRGPFASWQRLELTDVYHVATGNALSFAQANATPEDFWRFSLSSTKEPDFATLISGYSAGGAPGTFGTAAVASLRFEHGAASAGWAGAGSSGDRRLLGRSSVPATTVVAPVSGYTVADPWQTNVVSANRELGGTGAYAMASGSVYHKDVTSFEGRLAVIASGAGTLVLAQGVLLSLQEA